MPAADFVPLAALLGAPPSLPPPADAAATGEPPLAATASHQIDDDERSAAIGAARRFRAALADALDARVRILLRDLAADVLGRELRLAPCDLAALVARLTENVAATVVRVRVAPCDASRHFALPAVGDPALAPGDAILECREGSIDVRLGVRLADVLERDA